MKQILTSALRLAVVCGALALAACGGNTSGRAKTQDQVQTRSTAVLEIDELLAAADSLAGQTVTIEGVCTHTCKHGARKIFLMGSDDTQTIRVESIDEAYLARWEAQVKAQTAEKHGTTEAGCATEKAARQETGNTVEERIADFRTRIAARKAAEGKEYLSFYYVTATSYEIQQ